MTGAEAAAGHVRAEALVLRVEREVREARLRGARVARNGSSALRTGDAVGEDALDDERLQLREVLERLDVAQAEVVRRDVRDDADVRPVVPEPEAREPPRAVSSAAKVTVGSRSTACAEAGPVQSPS
jgi:hypothetical protein